MPYQCEHDGCEKRGQYNFLNTKIPRFCSAHKVDGMTDITSRRCIESGCLNKASQKLENDKKPNYCPDHKKDDMFNVYKTYCAESECMKKATFNMPNIKNPIYCKIHKKDGMIDLCHRRCAEKDCNKLPCQNIKGKTNPLYCATHKKDDMVNVVNKHCMEEGCEKQASFNYPGTNSRIYCRDHRKEGMTILSGVYCNEPNCGKIANQNYRNKKRGMQCLAHKKDNMIDVKNKLCLTPFCETICKKDKYKGYCFRCFVHLFPESEITRNQKTKEASVVSFLKTVFPNYTFDLDKRVQGGCSKRRPDCLLHLGNKVIIVEVDEDKHTNPNQETICENKRIMEISQDLSFCPIVFIRFNPDSQVDAEGKTHKSCWKINKRGLCTVDKKLEEWEARLHALQEKVQQWIDTETTKTIEMTHLFQDAIDDI